MTTSDRFARHVRAFLVVVAVLATSVVARGQENSLRFRKAYVPKAEVESIGVGFVPIPRDKFEETIDALDREKASTGPAHDTLDQAVWVGVFDGRSVSGRTVWTPPRSEASAVTETPSTAIVRLGSLGVFLDPESGDEELAIPDDAIRSRLAQDGDAAAVLANESSSRARLFVRSDGSFAAALPVGETVRLRWSAQVSPAVRGDVTASWVLPLSMRTTVWLIVPPDTDVSTEGEWLVRRIATDDQASKPDAADAPRLYRLDGKPSDGEPLRVRFSSAKAPPIEEFLYRATNRYEFTSRGLDVVYDLSLDCREGRVDALRFTLPPSVTPIELRRDGASVDVAPTGGPANASGVEWIAELPEPLSPSTATFSLRGIVAKPPTATEALPRICLNDATWAGETSIVVAKSPLELQGAFVDEGVVLSPQAADGPTDCRIRHRNERSKVTCRVARPPGRLAIESLLSLKTGPSSFVASLGAEIVATEGTTFEQELRLLRPWSLERIVVEPSDALRDWSIESRDERSQTIRLRFREGLSKGESIRLTCDAFLRVDDPTASWAGSTLRAFEFDNGVSERRAIAFFDEPGFRFRPIRLTDWHALSREELGAAQRIALGDSVPRAIVEDDDAFSEARFAFEVGEGRHSADSRTYLARSGSVVAGRIRIACEPLDGPLERLRVRFSDRLPAGSRWSTPESAMQAPPKGGTWSFDAVALDAGSAEFDAGETWELAFSRPMTDPFEVVVAYESAEEGTLVAPLASVPSASAQTGRLSVGADLLEGRTLVAEGLQRAPSIDEREDLGSERATRYRYDPTRRHVAELVASPHGATESIVDGSAVAELTTEVTSAGLFHSLTYRVSPAGGSRALTIGLPPGMRSMEIRARGDDREIVVRPESAASPRATLAPMPHLETVEMRYFQPIATPALWNEVRSPLPYVEGLRTVALAWTIESHGAVEVATSVEGWVDDSDLGDVSDVAAAPGASRSPEFRPPASRRMTIAISPETELSLTVYRTTAILQVAWIVFFVAVALAWLVTPRSRIAIAFSIGAVAVAAAYLPEPADAIRWGALYGFAVGLAFVVLFRRAPVASVSRDHGSRRLMPASPAVVLFFAVAFSASLAAIAQEARTSGAEDRAFRVLIPTDEQGEPTGAYYYASRDFYDRLLAAQRSLERPSEEWRIVGASYEGTLSPGVIDGTPRLSQLTLHLDIETFADDVTATIPLDRRFAEFAGMMEDASDGSVDVRWSDAGDALSLRFEKAGRRELPIPFYPAADPALPPSSRMVRILPFPSAKLYLRGPEEALDDLSVSGGLGAARDRTERTVAEFDLGATTQLVIGPRRTVSDAKSIVNWDAGLRVIGDPADCRIVAVFAGEAPLGAEIAEATVDVGPGWIVDASETVEPLEAVIAVPQPQGIGRRYRCSFSQPRTGLVRFSLTLKPRGSAEAGTFRTPRLAVDGQPPVSLFATLDFRDAATYAWASEAEAAPATPSSIPASIEFDADAEALRLPPDGAANFVVLDPIRLPTFGLRAEFLVAPDGISARYELATASTTDRWIDLDLPEHVETKDVYRIVDQVREPITWRRHGRRLALRLGGIDVGDGDASGTVGPIVIDAEIPRVRSDAVRLSLPRPDEGSAEVDLRVYRAPGLEVSIDVGGEWAIDPTFSPGAYVEGKGRGVGAYLRSANAATNAPNGAPAAPSIRTRALPEASGSAWTGVLDEEGRFILQFDVELDVASGPLDRLVLEAPSTLGEPVVVSPPGTLVVRAAPDAERSYWIYLPDRPLAPGSAAISLRAPLDVAAAERLAVRPIRMLNVTPLERFVLLPERLDGRRAEWSIVRLQAATFTERIASRIDDLGGEYSAFQSSDDGYEARVRRLESRSTSSFDVEWAARRVRFDAPGKYRAEASWDLSPQDPRILTISMPPGTTPESVEIEGRRANWRSTSDGDVEIPLIPSALPFRLSLAYRGAYDASDPRSFALATPTTDDRAIDGEAWIVEATPAAPWRLDRDLADENRRVEYVESRLDAFERTYSPAAPRAEGCTLAETDAFARLRLRDLAELRTLLRASRAIDSAAAEASQRIDRIADEYRKLTAGGSEESPAFADERSSTFDSGTSTDAFLVRFADGDESATIVPPTEVDAATAAIPPRKMAETIVVVLLCVAAVTCGGLLRRWFERMPLPVGTSATILLAVLFLPTAWVGPAIVVGFAAISAFAARRWLLPWLPRSSPARPHVR